MKVVQDLRKFWLDFVSVAYDPAHGVDVIVTGGFMAGIVSVPKSVSSADTFFVLRDVYLDNGLVLAFRGNYKKVHDGIWEPCEKHSFRPLGTGNPEQPDDPINQRTHVDFGIPIELGRNLLYEVSRLNPTP